MRLNKLFISLLAGCLAAIGSGNALAEIDQVRLADQQSLAFLPLMVMKNYHLMEKHLKAAGLTHTGVSWVTQAGGNNAIDAVLSGHLQFASSGVTPFITIWSKTHGQVMGVAATSAQPEYFNTRNPHLKKMEDLTAKDKIAVPAVKISTQAIFLEMMAAKKFGMANYQKWDPLTVTLSQPDATVAVLSPESEIDVAFVSQPFTYRLLHHQSPKIHTVFDSYEILGGPATLTMVWTMKKFHDENPKTYQAFLDAYHEAMEIIHKDKRAAAKAYLADSHDKLSVDDIVKIISDPKVEYSETPKNVMSTVKFFHDIKRIPSMPSNCKQMWFSNIKQCS